jgi:hypothetical protein
MISGTTATIVEDSRAIPRALIACGRRVGTVDEVREFMEQCDAGTSMCVANEDGMLVFTLQPFGEALELFIQLAVASRFGAFERQESAVRAIARDLGAQTIAFQARRSGWARRLGPEWIRRGTMEFVRCV